MSYWKRSARRDTKPARFQRIRGLVFTRLNYFDWKTLVCLAVLEVNVLRCFIETNRVG
jgi:hypothetical protein